MKNPFRNLQKWLMALSIMTFSVVAFLAMSGTVFAVAPNGFTSQVYQDSNSDGTIDRIVVVINGAEDLTVCTVDAGNLTTDWTYTGNGIGGSIASASCVLNTETITFIISGATASTTGTGSAPTIAYDNDDANNSIVNASGTLGTVAAATITDATSPVILSGSYLDNNADGEVDQVRFITSTDVGLECTVGAGYTWNTDLTVTEAGTVAIARGNGDTCVSNGTTGFTITLITPGATNTTGGTTAPVVTYTQPGGNNGFEDGASNDVPTKVGLTLSDGAAPIVVSIATNTSSSADIMTITYSEAMTYNNGVGWYTNADGTKASGADFGEMTLAGTIDGVGAWAGGTVGDMANNAVTDNSISLDVTNKILTITLNGQTGGYFTTASATTPLATNTFTPEAAVAVLKDQGGGLAVATTTVTSAPTITGAWDAIKPTISSVTVSDADHDGMIETAVVVFGTTSNIKDTSITNANAALGTAGTTSGSFATGTADDVTTTFTRTDDGTANDTAYSVATSDFVYSGATTKITDLAGNLLNTTTPGTIVTADKVEVDGANPILVSAVFNTSGGKETLTLTYSEALSIYTGGDGTTGNIAAGASATSTSTLGALTWDTTSTLAGFGSWNGTMNFACNIATSNLVALGATGKIVTITFNNTTGSFFTAGTVAPTTPTFTPVADTNDIKDAAGNAASTATKAASTTAWDVTVSTAVPAGFEKAGVNASGYDYYNWATIVNPTSNDFGAYLILFSTTQSNVTNKTFASTTEWTAANDSALATRTTATTAATNITGSNATYVALASVDSYGNVSAISNTLTVTPQQSGGVKADTTGPDAPTEFAASVNDSLKTVLTWVDPVASDLGTIQILKSSTGLNYYMVGTVNKGVKTYTDNSVEEGNVVYYKLASVDTKGNIGTETNVLNITVEKTAVVEVENVVEEETVVEGEEGAAEEPPVEPITITTESGTSVTLEDVTGHWAEPEITAMTEQEIVEGDENGNFNPNDNLNRAEAAAILYRVLGLEEPVAPTEASFTDVAIDAWYAGYISELKTLELVSGQTETTYGPALPINRAEFLNLAMNVYHYLTGTTTAEDQITTDAFSDLNTKAWYAPVVSEAYGLEFVSGSTCGETVCFNAGDPITRAEATKILYNMFYAMLTQ